MRYDYRNETTNNDRWIAEQVFPGLRRGYFVEIGAGNGRDASCTYALEKSLDWTGVLVEPQRDLFLQCLTFRPRARCYDVCVLDQEGFADFVRPPESSRQLDWGYAGVAENISPGKMDRLDMNRVTKVRCTTLEWILDNAEAPSVIDYLALDIEGSEYQALSSFPFDKYRFKAISTEEDACAELLQDNGYRKVTNRFSGVDYEHYFVWQP